MKLEHDFYPRFIPMEITGHIFELYILYIGEDEVGESLTNFQSYIIFSVFLQEGLIYK